MTRPQPRYKPGDKIGGRYQVHQVKMGGMGEVYLCLELKNEIPFALKTFQQRYLTNPKLNQFFENEVATWVALEKHPNIVRCFYMDTLDNRPFMILEWIVGEEDKGTDLRGWLRHGPLDLRTALDITIDVVRGLIHAQQKQPGIVHRDLKPENILMAQGKLAKITDFGLAQIVQQAGLKLAEAESEVKTEGRKSIIGKGGVAGTPAYMAPEQWLGAQLDTRTDIYAIGCILYEMLTGNWPFQVNTLDGLRRQHLEANIPKLLDGHEFSSVFDTLLTQCLAKKKNERFATMRDLLQELLQIYNWMFDEQPKAIPVEDEFNAIDYFYRGVTYSQLRKYDKALADINQTIQSDLTNFPQFLLNAYIIRGNIFADLQQHDDALTDFNQAIQVDPTNAKVYVNRGITYHDLKRYDEALVDYTKSIQLNPYDATAYDNRGDLYIDLQQYQEALLDYNRAIELNPQFDSAFNGRGRAFEHLQQYQEALLDYNRAIELNPQIDSAFFNRGRIYTHLQQYNEAIIDYNRAIELNPKNDKAYINRGLAYNDLQHYQEALADYDQAIKLNPVNANAYNSRGSTYNRLQEHQKALADFNRAIELEPAEPTLGKIYHNRGQTYRELHRYDDALTDFSRAIKFDPTNAINYAARGAMYAELQRHGEALVDLEQAIQLDPHYTLPYLNIGVMYYKNEKWQEALPYFEEAAQLGEPQGAHYTALIKQRLGMEATSQIGPAQQAFAAFQRATSLEAIRQAAAHYHFMVQADFIAAIEQVIAQQVPPEHRPYFEQRLGWLRQIAQEQNQ